MKYISQGKGRGIVYECLAQIHFENTGRKYTKEDVEAFMQELADESMESFVPNPLLGSNPKPAISSKIKNVIAADEQFNEIAKSIGGDSKQKKNKISSAVTGLTHAIMETMYGIKKEDFNYFNKKEFKLDPKQLEAVDRKNRLIKKYRMLRIVIYFFLMSVVKTFARFKKEEVLQIFDTGGLDKLESDQITEEIYSAVGIGAAQVFKNPKTAFYFVGQNAGIKSLFPEYWILKAAPEARVKPEHAQAMKQAAAQQEFEFLEEEKKSKKKR
jgi:hypothetical protein